MHKARIADHNVYVAAERITRQFILKAAKDMWARELRDPDNFYKMVKATDLLTHLQSICGVLHALDVLALQNEIQRFHIKAEGIPEYINTLEDSQKTSKRTENTITNSTLIMIATNAMLANVAFP